MPSLRRLLPSDLDEDQAAFYESLSRSFGSRPRRKIPFRSPDGALTPPLNIWLHCPPVGRGLARLGAEIRESAALGDLLYEIIILLVVGDPASYEWAAHSELALQFGANQADLRAVLEGTVPACLPEEDSRVFAAVAELIRDRDISQETFKACLERLGELSTVSLVALVGFYRLVDTLHSAFSVKGADYLAQKANSTG
jgi:hypothetical protein